MKVGSLLAAGAALVLGASGANAAIQVTSTRTPGTGDNAGFDVVRYFAFFLTSSQEAEAGATGLQAVTIDLRLHPLAPANAFLKFRFTDENGDGFPDADVDSSTVANRLTAASNGTLGTSVRIGPIGAGNWTMVLLDPPGEMSRSDPMTGELLPPSPEETYRNLKAIRVEGANPNSPDPAAKTNTPPGALFAVAVVPTGAPLCISGQIAADRGPISFYAAPLTCIPEPGAMVLGGLAAAGALCRGRGQRGLRSC